MDLARDLECGSCSNGSTELYPRGSTQERQGTLASTGTITSHDRAGRDERAAETCGEDIGTAEGRGFAARILDHMRARLLAFQEDTGNLYNLEATPAEGTSYRLARLDQQKYPDITSANTSPQASRNEPFYSNSTQLPVNYTDDIWEVLEIQHYLQARYTGGTGLHINQC